MMCEYCENGKKFIDIWDDEYSFFGTDCTTIKGNIFHVEAETAAGEINADIELDYKINFCPMCGTRLKSNGENI